MKKQPDFYDYVHDQIVNISKAGAYDALSSGYKDLEERYKNVRGDLRTIQLELANMEINEVITNPATLIQRISDICSDSLKNNRP